MRQKLIEAYEYSPPPTPGYFNEAVNDIQAKMTKDGVMMTNIFDITNTRHPTSTTNLNKVGSINFNPNTNGSNGMTMTNGAISGVDTITGLNTITGSSSGTTISNVDKLSFTNTSSYISPSVALANNDENVIGYTKAKYGASTTGGNNWSISTYNSPPFPSSPKGTNGQILVSLSLPTGVWLITYGILLKGMGQANNTAVVRVIVGTDKNNIIQSNQQGPVQGNGQVFLNGSLVYRAIATTTLSLYGYQTGNSGSFDSQSASSSRQNFFSATRLA